MVGLALRKGLNLTGPHRLQRRDDQDSRRKDSITAPPRGIVRAWHPSAIIG